METHASAIASAVSADPANVGRPDAYFDAEKTASARTWQAFNLLAFMKARGEVEKGSSALTFLCPPLYISPLISRQPPRVKR